jgi:hypothetical protein
MLGTGVGDLYIFDITKFFTVPFTLIDKSIVSDSKILLTKLLNGGSIILKFVPVLI